ncbi:HAD family hydrolase [Parapedobacter tibetensis]|uniref:HAD family hydrolase n=1 Tax=Parapedobacter tibetensis TaxID=2972951 RepID=UPI00214D48CB|nr:HAD family hydrolase [Parapedobacter tibetensis]
MIKGLIFDYGGTLDTNGCHWASIFWDIYQKHHIQVNKRLYAKAYAYGEKALATAPIIKPNHTFLDLLVLKLEQQFDFLATNGIAVEHKKLEEIAITCEDIARNTTHIAEGVLNKLSVHYPLALVSNFYGNLNTVLTDFGIRPYFKGIIESAVVGVRKPDPEIYHMGVELLGLAAHQCVVIGDSYTKDMLPAKRAGCKTIWLNVEGWQESGIDEFEIVDKEIDSLDKLHRVLQNWTE